MSELEYRYSRHVALVRETPTGWLWSCKHCAAGEVMDSATDAMAAAIRHMLSEVPWWRKALRLLSLPIGMRLP